MGLPIKFSSTASLFDNLLKLHSKNKKSFYYKHLITILSHELIAPLLSSENEDICKIINRNNIVYASLSTLIKHSKSNEDTLRLLFENWEDPNTAISNSIKLIYRIKNYYDDRENENKITFEYLYHFNKLFNKLKLLQEKYDHNVMIESGIWLKLSIHQIKA